MASAWPGLLLVIITLALFSPSVRYELVNLDDHVYITQNRMVHDGVTWPSVKAAFSTVWQGMWAPLLWFSYMVDVSLFGIEPFGFHLTNVLLHAANAGLAYLLFLIWIRKPWRAVFAAAIWALHPLRVESVAWVAERKDVLSGFFFLACLLAYTKAHKDNEASRIRILLFVSVVFLCMGLMVKPMLVMTPVILLLLDIWPLGRLRLMREEFTRRIFVLIFEKWPYWLLGAAAAMVAYGAHAMAGSVGGTGWLERLRVIPQHYAFYIIKTVSPRDLTVLYDNMAFSYAEAIVALALMLGATWWFFSGIRFRQNLIVGWLFFVVIFLPVIGFVHFGTQTLADRFTYLPAFGFSAMILFLWPSADRFQKIIRAGFCLTILLVLAAQARQQLSVWRNTETLYTNLLSYYPHHPMGRYNLAMSHLYRGNAALALEILDGIIGDASAQEVMRYGKTQAMSILGSSNAAREWLSQHPPDTASACPGYWEWNMGMLSLFLKDYEASVRFADAALGKIPHHDAYRIDVILMGMTATYELGDGERALVWARRWDPYRDKQIIQLKDLLPYYLRLWLLAYRDVATDYFLRLIDTYPDNMALRNNLIWSFSTASWSPLPSGRVLELVEPLKTDANGNAFTFSTISAAHANDGDFESARLYNSKALDLAQAEGATGLASRLKVMGEHFARREPWREDAFARLWEAFYDK